MRLHPSFEIEANEMALAALQSDLVAVSFGGPYEQTWLRDRSGNIFAVNISQRDLQPMFEVFSLAITPLAELIESAAAWKLPAIDGEVPEGLRALLSRRPETPTPPDLFDAWPFSHWRTEVLRRAEFIVENIQVESALGQGPHNMHSAAPPSEAPPEASAACEVAAGLLFTGPGGDQLLLAVDWMPFNLIATRDSAQIARFAENCEAIQMPDYAERFLARD